MAKIANVKWFTKERMDLITEENKQKYEKYYKSCTIKNTDVINTTFKTYKSNFYLFLCYLAVYHDNIDLYSQEFMDDAIDIMEGYMSFCSNTLLNGKKTINNKIAAVSTFYIWSLKRGLILAHPFDNKLDRMKKSTEEKIINSYFLTSEQIETIREELKNNTKKFDIQDRILFEVAIDSANRIGSLEKLTLSSLDIDNMVFNDIREKEGYHVEVVFEDNAKELITEWLEMRKDNFDKLQVDSLLITYYRGEYSPMTRGVIHYKMRKYGEVIGIPDFHAHCARKSKIDQIYRETGDLFVASAYANHKSTQVTSDAYIKKTGKSELRQKINDLKEKKKQGVVTEDSENKIDNASSNNRFGGKPF